MALSTTENILRLWGLTDQEAYQIGRYSGQSELNAEMARVRTIAQAYLKTRAPNYYTGAATANTDLDALFAEAEATLAAYYWGSTPWARKVLGTHWAVDQEDSDSLERFLQGLIDRAQTLISPYVSVDEEESPFAMPAIAPIGPIGTDELDSVTYDLDQLLVTAEPGGMRTGP
jgi:hypothetical protein